MGLLTAWAWAVASAATPPAYDVSWARLAPLWADEGQVVVEASPRDELRLRCASPGDAPVRRALIPAEGGVVVVDPPLPQPVRVADGWWLPAPGDGARFWSIDRPDCALTARRTTTSPERLDRAERDAETPAKLRATLLGVGAWRDDPRVAQLLGRATDPWAAYAGVRLAGGFADVRRDLRPTTAATRATDGAWRVDEAVTWRVHGPARIRVDARLDGPPRTACLEVDDAPAACQPAPRSTTLGVDADGALTAAPPPDAPPLALRTWHVVVGPGPHTIRGPGAGEVRARVVELDALKVLAPLPDGPAVWAEADPAWLPPAWTASAAPSTPTVLLFVPAPAGVPEPGEVRWVPPAQAHTPPPHPDGLIPVLVVGADDERCTLVLPDGRRWVSHAARGLVRVGRAGDVDPTAPWRPAAEGCDVRVQDLTPAGSPDRWVGLPATRVAPDAPATLGFDAPPTGTLRLSVHTQRPDLPTTVQVRADGQSWVATLTGPAARVARASDGGAWTAGVTLELPLRAQRVQVLADHPVAVRVQADGDHPVAAPVVPPPGPSDPVSLRRASRAIDRAPSDAARADALRARSALLDARGRLQDLELARALDPTTDAADAVRAVVASSRDAWLTAGAWGVLDPAWLPADALPDDPGPVLDAAARGDAVTVARAVPELAGRSWIVAARTQTLTTEDAVDAYAALLDTPAGDPEHPAFAGVRAWSRWTELLAVTGTDGVRAELAEAPREAPDLWPDAWPDDEVVDLAPGWSLRLGRDGLVGAQARCRAREPEALAGPCRLEHTALDGTRVAGWTLSPWGGATAIDVGRSTGATFLEVEADGLVDVQVRVPRARLDALTQVRAVRRMVDRTARVDVAGPTVVRVTAWGAPGGTLTVARSGAAAQRPLAEAGVRVEQTIAGRETLEITAPRGTWLTVHARTPSPRTREPEAHGALVDAIRRGTAPIAPLLPASPAAPEPARTVPPRPEPPWTLLADLSGGFGGDVDADLEEAVSLPARGAQHVGLASRPGAAPVWIEAQVGAYEAVDRWTVAEARLAVEGWWGAPPWRGFVGLTGTLRTDTAPDPLPVLRGRAYAGLSLRPRAWIDLRARLDLDGALALQDPEAVLTATPQAVLWSPWRADHPTWLAVTAEVRAHPSPWVRVGASGRMRTNSPGDAEVVDSWSGGLDLRAGVPAFRGRVELGVDHRPRDLDRDLPITSPYALLGARAAVWARRRVVLQPYATLLYQHAFRRVSFDLGVTLLWSRRAGLPDLMPTATDAKEALGWFEPDRWQDGPAP